MRALAYDNVQGTQIWQPCDLRGNVLHEARWKVLRLLSATLSPLHRGKRFSFGTAPLSASSVCNAFRVKKFGGRTVCEGPRAVFSIANKSKVLIRNMNLQTAGDAIKPNLNRRLRGYEPRGLLLYSVSLPPAPAGRESRKEENMNFRLLSFSPSWLCSIIIIAFVHQDFRES